MSPEAPGNMPASNDAQPISPNKFIDALYFSGSVNSICENTKKAGSNLVGKSLCYLYENKNPSAKQPDILQMESFIDDLGSQILNKIPKFSGIDSDAQRILKLRELILPSDQFDLLIEKFKKSKSYKIGKFGGSGVASVEFIYDDGKTETVQFVLKGYEDIPPSQNVLFAFIRAMKVSAARNRSVKTHSADLEPNLSNKPMQPDGSIQPDQGTYAESSNEELTNYNDEIDKNDSKPSDKTDLQLTLEEKLPLVQNLVFDSYNNNNNYVDLNNNQDTDVNFESARKELQAKNAELSQKMIDNPDLLGEKIQSILTASGTEIEPAAMEDVKELIRLFLRVQSTKEFNKETKVITYNQDEVHDAMGKLGDILQAYYGIDFNSESPEDSYEALINQKPLAGLLLVLGSFGIDI